MEHAVVVEHDKEARALFGRYDEHVKQIEAGLRVQVVMRNGQLKITGDTAAVGLAGQVVDDLLRVVRKGEELSEVDVQQAIDAVKDKGTLPLSDTFDDRIEIWSKRQFVAPQTAGQCQYVRAIRQSDIVFAIGPAGTGKTYLAMAMAVCALKRGEVSRIILTRPAVEAGERLGFLPGDLEDKVTPYLRPLNDALYDMMEGKRIQNFMQRGVIEVAPLAYMRGRTLNDAFIILDEAQNSTPEQMKMFLTRLGFDSKAVVTGDVTQSDLPTGQTSGLVQVQSILSNVPGIQFVTFAGTDVVRHQLVQQIVEAYDQQYRSGAPHDTVKSASPAG